MRWERLLTIWDYTKICAKIMKREADRKKGRHVHCPWTKWVHLFHRGCCSPKCVPGSVFTSQDSPHSGKYTWAPLWKGLCCALLEDNGKLCSTTWVNSFAGCGFTCRSQDIYSQEDWSSFVLLVFVWKCEQCVWTTHLTRHPHQSALWNSPCGQCCWELAPCGKNLPYKNLELCREATWVRLWLTAKLLWLMLVTDAESLHANYSAEMKDLFHSRWLPGYRVNLCSASSCKLTGHIPIAKKKKEINKIHHPKMMTKEDSDLHKNCIC